MGQSVSSSHKSRLNCSMPGGFETSADAVIASPHRHSHIVDFVDEDCSLHHDDSTNDNRFDPAPSRQRREQPAINDSIPSDSKTEPHPYLVDEESPSCSIRPSPASQSASGPLNLRIAIEPTAANECSLRSLVDVVRSSAAKTETEPYYRIHIPHNPQNPVSQLYVRLSVHWSSALESGQQSTAVFEVPSNSDNHLALPSTTISRTLQSLPILRLIESFLNFSSAIALSYTCSHLLHSSNYFVEDLFRRSPKTAELDGIRIERLALLRVLKRNKDESSIGPIYNDSASPCSMCRKRSCSKAMCSECATQHPTCCFSLTEMRKTNGSRQCLGHEGRLWICPHKELNFTKAKLFFEFAAERPSGLPGDFQWSSSIEECKCKSHFTWLGSDGIMQWRLILFSRGSFTKAAVVKALAALDVHICPHTRMSNPAISACFTECSQSFRQCKCIACSEEEVLKCKICAVNVYYQIDKVAWDGNAWGGKNALLLCIWRPLGRFDDPLHWYWLRQLTLQSELNDLRREWEDHAVDIVTQRKTMIQEHGFMFNKYPRTPLGEERNPRYLTK